MAGQAALKATESYALSDNGPGVSWSQIPCVGCGGWIATAGELIKFMIGVRGIGAPRGTPVDVIAKLNKEINTGLTDPMIAARIADLASTPFIASPAELDQRVIKYTKKWGDVIRGAGIKVDAAFQSAAYKLVNDGYDTRSLQAGIETFKTPRATPHLASDRFKTFWRD